MAFNIKIDLENRYQLKTIGSDLSSGNFTTILKDGTPVELGVRIDGEHPLLPDAINLAFGPLDKNGDINDSIKLHHSDHSKTFSTIVFAGMKYLKENPGLSLWIDGSDLARAYMYYRCVKKNFDYLTQHFEIYGVNYYIRILKKMQDDDTASIFDVKDVIASSQTISSTEQIRHEKLYNCIIFKLRNK